MDTQKKPRNIFEQILFGLEATNENVVIVSEEIATLRQEVAELKSALCLDVIADGYNTEPNALGAVENGTIEGTNS